ncbi:Rrf2 family transcriptional regulator group III [Paramagnetospirillum magnetotacticum MS-1]|uniref:Rrf2 family transcriptional regulator group III n=2 Tax=Paramagnetospirillum magnetotacticum TaxID=188 RepID=A0A0C2YX16_PARME|nr:Rrf2 family transcriptional regulator group III [Paramagnetospirillum magnetotacticum MS-1]
MPMAKNCRFAVAVHIASLLASMDGKACTSEWIAGSVNTNPVVVRRLLSALAKAGLVHSTRGSAGGSVLALGPERISLLDIHRAVDEEEEPALHNQPPNPDCPVGRNIQSVLVRVIERADAARDGVLSATLLSDVVGALKAEGK